jgi:hypothetical protein
VPGAALLLLPEPSTLLRLLLRTLPAAAAHSQLWVVPLPPVQQQAAESAGAAGVQRDGIEASCMPRLRAPGLLLLLDSCPGAAAAGTAVPRLLLVLLL